MDVREAIRASNLSETDLNDPVKSQSLSKDGHDNVGPQSKSTDGLDTVRPQSTSYEGLNTPRSQSTSSERLNPARPQSTSNERLNTVKPQSTSSEGINTVRPQSTSSEGLNTPRPQSTSNERLNTVRPQSTSNEGLNTPRPQSTSSEGLNPARPQSTSSKGLDTVRPQSTSNEGLINTVRPQITSRQELQPVTPQTTFSGDDDDDDDDDDDSWILSGRKRNHVLIGCTGSVAATHLQDLLNELTKLKHRVEARVVATDKALHFIDCNQITARVYTDADECESWTVSQPPLHVVLGLWADVLLIAPLDANTLAKMATGLCDNLLTSVVRSWDMRKPVLFAPSMNRDMWCHPVTAGHIATLRSFGYEELSPVIDNINNIITREQGGAEMAGVCTIVQRVAKNLDRIKDTSSVTAGSNPNNINRYTLPSTTL